MSRAMPQQPSPGSSNPQRQPAAGAGMPAQKPGLTTPKAPSVGASAPPNKVGQPANLGGNGAKGAAGAAAGAGAAPPANVPMPTQGIPPIDQLQGRPIGRVLTKMGKVNREQVVEALDFQKRKGGALGRILIDLGYVKETDLNIALAAQKGYELVNLEGVNIPPIAINAVPPQIATTNKVLPISFDPATKKLTVVMANHENFRALDDLRSLMGYNVSAKIGDPDQIDKLIQKHYQAASEGLGEILGELAKDDTLTDLKNRGESIDLETIKEAADASLEVLDEEEDIDLAALESQAEEAPVVRLVNIVLTDAIKRGASDIHIEPYEKEYRVRYRIDGVLYEMMKPPLKLREAITSRVKILAKLDIAEKRLPQDGRIKIKTRIQGKI